MNIMKTIETMKKTNKLNLKAMVLSAFAVILAVCSSCNTSEKAIGYSEVENYFLRNDVTDYSPRVITTSEEMRQYFGMAAVMGPGGMPTSVDFDKENVIAIVEPQTDRDTELKIESIKRQEGGMVVTYKVVVSGDSRSYQTVPCLLVKVNKKYGYSAQFVRH